MANGGACRAASVSRIHRHRHDKDDYGTRACAATDASSMEGGDIGRGVARCIC